MSIPVTATLAAGLALLLLGLSVRISQLRMRHRISLGDGGNPELLRTMRAHGNGAEHAPIFILLALAYELTRGADVWLIGVAAAFVLARLFYTAGMIGRGLHRWRMWGAGATYLLQALLALSVLLVVLRA